MHPDGCYRLAVAVIAQTVKDAEVRSPERRPSALYAIRHGGLDPWIDIVSGADHDLHDKLHEGLRQLVA